jgi:hypothetical protein
MWTIKDVIENPHQFTDRGWYVVSSSGSSLLYELDLDSTVEDGFQFHRFRGAHLELRYPFTGSDPFTGSGGYTSSCKNIRPATVREVKKYFPSLEYIKLHKQRKMFNQA